jgi:hypothetical protein
MPLNQVRDILDRPYLFTFLHLDRKWRLGAANPQPKEIYTSPIRLISQHNPEFLGDEKGLLVFLGL